MSKAKATQVDAGYHLYGYWVEATVDGGGVVKREEYGNSVYDSTSVFSVSNGGTRSLEDLQRYALSTAKEMAGEVGLTENDVQVFHDTDTEESLREALNDVTAALVA